MRWMALVTGLGILTPALATAPCALAAGTTAAPADSAAKRITFGRSVQGRPLVAYEFGSSGPLTIIFGAFHGDEGASSKLATAFVQYLQKHPEQYAGCHVVVVPRTNPDGLAHGTRVNARGVDINRNFPTADWRAKPARARYNPGPRPESEPETRAVMALISEYGPDRIVTIHQPASQNNYDGPAAEIARAMARQNHYPVTPQWDAPTPGSFGTYYGKERGLPVVTLELGDGMDWEANRRALLAAVHIGRGTPAGVVGGLAQEPYQPSSQGSSFPGGQADQSAATRQGTASVSASPAATNTRPTGSSFGPLPPTGGTVPSIPTYPPGMTREPSGGWIAGWPLFLASLGLLAAGIALVVSAQHPGRARPSAGPAQTSSARRASSARRSDAGRTARPRQGKQKVRRPYPVIAWVVFAAFAVDTVHSQNAHDRAHYTVVVNKATNVLKLFRDGGVLVGAYRVTTGIRKCTPEGVFRVTDKRVVSKSGNGPLGSHWIGISARPIPGRRRYGIHGTNEPETIGQCASAGCVRMLNCDVAKLYALVSEGSKVIIVDVPAGTPGAAGSGVRSRSYPESRDGRRGSAATGSSVLRKDAVPAAPSTASPSWNTNGAGRDGDLAVQSTALLAAVLTAGCAGAAVVAIVTALPRRPRPESQVQTRGDKRR